MSDFDKEAEREKLRKKYEQDQNDREVAEKMSELLLQGATMTNAHCSECGDPIFRYDGQEFCATCEKAVDRGGDATDSEDADAAGDGEDQNIEVTAPDEETRVQFGDTDGEATDPATQQDQPAQSQDSTTQSPQGTPSQQTHAPQAQSTPQATEPSREVPSIDPGSADVSTARESLVRTLTRFSQQAEATEDPQRATEYLAAAREAAETLAALRR